jgi:uncharacterized protein (DUF1778 family)
MRENQDDDVTVEKGEEHLSARVDEDSYHQIRVAAAANNQSMAAFLREAAADALAELDEGNPNRRINPPMSN